MTLDINFYDLLFVIINETKLNFWAQTRFIEAGIVKGKDERSPPILSHTVSLYIAITYLKAALPAPAAAAADNQHRRLLDKPLVGSLAEAGESLAAERPF